MRVKASDIFQGLARDEAVELDVAAVKLGQAFLEHQGPDLVLVGQKHDLPSFLDERDVLVDLQLHRHEVFVQVDCELMQIAFGLVLAWVALQFADGSLDDPGVVAECLEEDKVVSQRKLVLADVSWLETIEEHELLPGN